MAKNSHSKRAAQLLFESRPTRLYSPQWSHGGWSRTVREPEGPRGSIT